MAQSLPLVLVPGLTCTARLYAPQIAALWPFGQVTVADHRRDDDMAAIAARILVERAAALRARRPVDGRLHRFRHDAAGARAHRQARAARHLGAPRYAGANRGAQNANRHGAVGPLRRDPGSGDPALFEREASARRAPHDDRASDDRGNRAGSFRAAAQRDHVAAGFAAAAGVDQVPDVGAGRRRTTSRRRRNSTRKSPTEFPARS